MTDFHHSLDRALDEEHPYAWAPPADTSFVEKFTVGILEPGSPVPNLVQKALAALGLNDEPVAYDGYGAPLYAHQIPAEGTE